MHISARYDVGSWTAESSEQQTPEERRLVGVGQKMATDVDPF